MEELFGSNLFAIYIIACIAVISYSNFRENQRMSFAGRSQIQNYPEQIILI